MKKLILILLFSVVFSLVIITPAAAFCPVCIIGTGVGAGVLYIISTDHLMTGLFFGAFIISILSWILELQLKRNKKITKKNLLFIFLFYLIITAGFYFLANKNIIPLITNTYIFYFGYLFGSLSFAALLFATTTISMNYRKVKIKFWQSLIILLIYILIFYLVFLLVKLLLPLIWQ